MRDGDRTRCNAAASVAALAARAHGYCAAPAPSTRSQHAAASPPPRMRSGRSRRQRSNACGQRGWNAQPGGIAVSRGIDAVDLRQPLALVDDRRNRAHQADRVRMLRPVDHVGDRPDLDDAPGVHHGDAIGGLGDDAHVVRDQHHRGAVVAAQPLQELDDLRLDRHVERGRRLVGDDQLRLRRRARARSPRAGACRRRTGAGSGRCAAPAAGMPTSSSRPIARLRARPRPMRQVRADRLDQLPADRVQRIERWSADPGRPRRSRGREPAHLRRTAGCRCAGLRGGSRRRRCARAGR